MRKAALLGATLLALSSAPAFAFGGLFDDIFGSDQPYGYPGYGYARPVYGYGHHHAYRPYRHYARRAMIAPGIVNSPVGPFIWDDTLGEWEHWRD